MLKIIVDGSADMPEGWKTEYGLEILPMPIQIGNLTYYQGEDIDAEKFYRLLEDENNIPQTAAPSPNHIVSFVERVCDVGDTVLAINVSGKMSATVEMTRQAVEKLKGKLSFHVFDSGAGSAVLALMAREARLREKAGASMEEILDVLEDIRKKVMVILTVDKLEFARRSGRVSALKATLTSLLKIKPIITLKDGVMSVSDMVRTRKKSLDRLVEKIKDEFGSEPLKIAVVHSQDLETAELLKTMVNGALNSTETILTELSIAVAANLGPKTVGIVALPNRL
jgi:DegV family protein with EDD domain